MSEVKRYAPKLGGSSYTGSTWAEMTEVEGPAEVTFVRSLAYNALKARSEELEGALRAAEQCIGELSPTQARVEVMQMVQAALSHTKEQL